MKYKKALLSAGTFVFAAAPVALTVSCGTEFKGNYKREGGKIYLITDSGSVKDKSFNEYIFNGVEKFSEDTDTSYSYIHPQTISKGVFQKSYTHAIKHGAEAIVLPGFHHSVDGKFSEIANKNQGVAFIGIDTFDIADNALNLAYSTEQSAFLAAVYTGIYMNMNERKNINGKTLKVSTFGGAAYPSVTSYMDGWLQGIRFFNDKAENQYPLWAKMEPVFVKGNGPSENDFSGDFNPGSATTISQTLIKNGAQVVMPVAGPQTADFLGAILELGKKNVYAIGVDTDQSQSYDAKLMLGSALKGIDSSTTLALNELYNGVSTKSGFGISSKKIKFKNGFQTFNYKSKFNGRPVVNFQPSKATPKPIYNSVISNSIYIAATDYDNVLSKTYPTGTVDSSRISHPENVKWPYIDDIEMQKGYGW